MSLVEKQMKFALLVSKLIQKAFELGYGVTFGDANREWRGKDDFDKLEASLCDSCKTKLSAAFSRAKRRIFYGSEVSLHRQRLAIDLNLFRMDSNGRWQYLPSTEAHAELAQYWVSLDDECTWGGEADRQDGNHYSLKHEGRW